MVAFGRLLASVTVLALVGCTGTPDHEPDPSGEAGGRQLPEFSVVDLLAELPASVRTDGVFELRAGDLVAASELARVERPSNLDDVSPWVSTLVGVGEDAQVHVPMSVPLDPSAPADMVEEDLHWSVLDVDRFVSWTSLNAVTTVVAGNVDAQTLDDLPEAGGVRSAGEGADLEGTLENASPARPTGVPMRMVTQDGWLVSSPFTTVVRQWRDNGRTLADDPVLVGMAEILDERDAYSMYASQPSPLFASPVPPAVVEALRLTPASFPEFDVFAIGWSVSEGEPLVSVVYHDTDGRDVAETRALVEERWTTLSFRGRRMSDLVSVAAVEIDGANVVVDARLAGDLNPDVIVQMADADELTFWGR